MQDYAESGRNLDRILAYEIFPYSTSASKLAALCFLSKDQGNYCHGSIWQRRHRSQQQACLRSP
jgi:hypothetical protein